MYALVEAGRTAGGVEVIHRYPRFTLVRVKDATALPSASDPLPDDGCVFVNGQRLPIPAGEFPRKAASPRSVLRFAGPLPGEWMDVLRDLGAVLHFWCPPYGVCAAIPARLTTTRLRQALPALLGLQPYDTGDCARPLRGPSAHDLAGAGQAPDWVDVVCFEQDDVARVRAAGVRLGAQPIDQSRYKLRLRYAGNLDVLRSVRGVKIADRARRAVLAWAPLHEAVGADAGTESAPTGLSGRGQVVAVADTGLDSGVEQTRMHPDFAGRIRFLGSWPVNASWDDYATDPGSDDGGRDSNSGHGTHVAGLVLGDGTRSRGKYRGLAPAAELVFQAIEQYTEVTAEHSADIASGYYLSGRPLDLRTLFGQAREQGARIHVNAWGDPADGAYTDDCFEADLFLWQNPDALVLFAAGNEGADEDGDRQLDRESLYAPASAKNVVAIGALEGPRAGVGFRGTWAGFDPRRRRFRHSRDRDAPVSGDPARIALISSTGPTVDGRIKPDICAPGTNLPATKSQATAARGWGLASPLPHYMYMGGTSMATGVAGGAAALLREAWQTRLGSPPSGPALKALLVHGATSVLRRDRDRPEPRHVAGFGRLSLPGCLPGEHAMLLDRADAGLRTGEVHASPFTQLRTGPFRAVLSWYDSPGERLINDLDLCLVAADGARVWGNHEPGEAGQPDRINTVECIDLPQLAAGDWVLEVIAANVPTGTQGFALVCSARPGTGEAPAAADVTTPAEDLPADDPAPPALPLAVFKGIGATYQRRLDEAGVHSVPQLLAMDLPMLARVLKTSVARVRRIGGRADVLRRLLGVTLPAVLIGRRLSAVRSAAAPVGVANGDWLRARELWLPLLDVFDKSAHDDIAFEDLFTQGPVP